MSSEDDDQQYEAEEEEEVEEQELVAEEIEDLDENEQQTVEDEEEVENEDAQEESGEQNEEEAAVEEEVEEEEAAASDDEEEFAGFDENEIKATKKEAKRKVLSDDEGEENEEVEATEGVEEEEGVAEAEEEGEEEVVQEQEEEEEVEPTSKKRKEHMSDLDAVIEKRKLENAKKFKRKKNDDSETLTNADNMIAALITEMKNSAVEDRAANEKNVCALQKLKLLPVVVNILQKSDYHASMIELGILGAMAEWLAPLPDRSLPNIKIREELIAALQDFGEINVDYLKSSGIGKAAMFLYKHPKETRSNKEKLEKLIHNWSRPIFNLDSNFKQLSKEERQQRDMEHVHSLQRRASNEPSNEMDLNNALNDKYSQQKSSKKSKKSTSEKEDTSVGANGKVLRPGDPGFCPRARVPIPSAKDYVVRPKSNVDEMQVNEKKATKKPESRLEKHKRHFIDMKRQSKATRAITMSVEGRKMDL